MQAFAFLGDHLYLLAGLYFLLFWIILFALLGKKWPAKRKMLIISSIFMVEVPFIEHLTLIDWWRPNFMFDTFFHFEDFLFGFAIAGVASGVYSLVASRSRMNMQNLATFSLSYKLFVIIGSLALIPVLFFLSPLNSFWASVVALAFLNLLVLPKIPYILPSVLVTSFILVVIAIPGYFFGSYLHPGWIQEYWILGGWPGKTFLTVPIGEYVYYFLQGFSTPVAQELLFARMNP